MDLFNITTFSLLLIYVPGYIFIHTVDYFLLKKEKSQFEKTVQGLIAGIIIFIIFILIRYQPLNICKEKLIKLFILFITTGNKNYIQVDIIKCIGVLYLLLCAYSFIIACIYSIIRKCRWFSSLLQKITKRDYFPSVDLRFYYEALNKIVIITLENNNRYLGYLIACPDNIFDKKIIIYQPHIIENEELFPLKADKILLDIDKTILIEIIKEV